MLISNWPSLDAAAAIAEAAKDANAIAAAPTLRPAIVASGRLPPSALSAQPVFIARPATNSLAPPHQSSERHPPVRLPARVVRPFDSPRALKPNAKTYRVGNAPETGVPTVQTQKDARLASLAH